MSKWARVIAGVVGLLICVAIAFQVDATVGKRIRYQSLKGLVTDSHSRIVVGATVYFIDSSTINTTPITPSAILDGTAEAYDEPLEDLIRADLAKTAKEQTIPKSVTDKKGRFRIKKLNRDALYYAFVVPAAADLDHLPGGDASRIAFAPKAVSRKGLTIQISWKYPEDATRIGSSACYVCHGPGSVSDSSGCKKHGHALMFNKPGQPTANQNPAGHPGANVLALQEKFTVAADVSAVLKAGYTGKTLYFQEYDATTKNFAVYEDIPGTKVDPTTGKGGDVWFKAYLWRTGVTSNYNITLENVKVKTDPNNYITYPVKLFMGAYIRQRIFVSVPGLKSAYPMLEYRAMPGSASQGANGQYDRSRVPFAESSFSGFYTYTSKTKTMALTQGPPAFTVNATTGAVSRTSNVTCGLCHVGLDRTDTFPDPDTGENMAHTVADANGIMDLGGDGMTQEMDIGCEECHGPGSKHREEALKGVFPATSKRTAPVDNSAKFIVNPALLDSSRASLICGRCHDARGIMKEEAGEPRPAVGISRAEFLAEYVVAKGLSAAQRWADGESGKGGHHGFTYDNWLISKHAKNSRQLVGCDDCHDSMGDSDYRYFVKGDPDDPNGGLCTKCHAVDVNTHTMEKTGDAMTGAGTACRQCHMARTGKAGAGRPGLLLGTPTGLSSDANIIYWEGDQSAHHMHVLTKFTAGVAGVQPGLAMPVPYTNSCGTCHDASKLQFQQPR